MSFKTRKCTKCKEIKPIEEYYEDKRVISDGRTSKCKICTLQYSRQHILDNADRYQNYRILRKHNHPEKVKSASKKYKDSHKEKLRTYNKQWRDNNIEIAREKARKYVAKRNKIPQINLSNRMAISIYRSLRGNKKGRKWESLVGYTVEKLKKHLERQFVNGMSWGNIGEWHIDHKIPKSAFNFEKPEDLDFKKCWCLKNLQPMWAPDNLRKHTKLKMAFQPSLTL